MDERQNQPKALRPHHRTQSDQSSLLCPHFPSLFRTGDTARKWAIKFVPNPTAAQLQTLSLSQNLSRRCKFLSKIEEFEVRPSDRMLQIVMPCYNKRDLHQMVEPDTGGKPTSFTIDSARPIIFQIITAVNFLHKEGFCHLGICPAHVVLYPEGGPEDFSARLVGLSRVKRIGESFEISENDAELLDYPELTEPRLVDPVIDFWQLGKLIEFMFRGEVPGVVIGVVDKLLQKKIGNLEELLEESFFDQCRR
jgi:serine/threonine protein kinase